MCELHKNMHVRSGELHTEYSVDNVG